MLGKKRVRELFDTKIAQYLDPYDKPALRNAWDGFVLALYQNRDISAKQLRNFNDNNPFDERDEK